MNGLFTKSLTQIGPTFPGLAEAELYLDHISPIISKHSLEIADLEEIQYRKHAAMHHVSKKERKRVYLEVVGD